MVKEGAALGKTSVPGRVMMTLRLRCYMQMMLTPFSHSKGFREFTELNGGPYPKDPLLLIYPLTCVAFNVN